MNVRKKFAFWKKSITFATAIRQMGRFQSGQMGQTVNLLRHRFGGSNPSLPTHRKAIIDLNRIFC